MDINEFMKPLTQEEKSAAQKILEEVVGLQIPDSPEYFEGDDLELAARYEFSQFKPDVDALIAEGVSKETLMLQIESWYRCSEIFLLTKEALSNYCSTLC